MISQHCGEYNILSEIRDPKRDVMTPDTDMKVGTETQTSSLR